MTFEEWAKIKGYPYYDLEPIWNTGSIDRFSDIAREAWEAATLAEREECAKVCDELLVPDGTTNSSVYEVATLDCAEAIRARG